MAEDYTPGGTEHLAENQRQTAEVRGFRLDVLDGEDEGTVWRSASDRCVIGSHASCDLTLSDRAVSGFQCELTSDAKHVRIRDLDSRNGTTVDGVRIVEAFLKRGSTIRVGRTSIRFQFLARTARLPLSRRTRFGLLVGESSAMRRMFAVLERAADTRSTLLLQGETGTGKTATARSIHQEGPRRDQPFVVLDCSAVPANLLESELFGHEKGAFTGAHSQRIGAFEEADGGTLFIDELGELPLALQTKLLSVVENREFRRVGGNRSQPTDVRLIAATNRNLRAEVNAGRFREDLFYRLSVISVEVPPLRERLQDLPVLVDELLARMGVAEEQMALARNPEFLASLRESAWPGNIRELRNSIERYLLFQDLQDAPPASDPALDELADDQPGDPIRVHTQLPYSESRKHAIAEFERIYLTELLATHAGKVGQAARGAGMARAYLYRLLQRHQLVQRAN